VTDLLDRLRTALADRYAIEHEIGRGGMATVYLAEDLKHRRKVAVKLLHPEVGAALGAERFLREIEVAARLAHPHILPLHDSGHADGFLYYVMPFVEGESLRQRLDREKQLPLDEALHIAEEVADALSYAHSRGIVHRDIKPENILLESGHAMVTDFGIAAAMSDADAQRLTETGIALGTPAYMSPEQAAGARDLDGRSDLYSLGCVLYEMLAGSPPFAGPTTESIVRQHLTVDPPPVTTLRPAVPAHIAGTLERALAKTPADRFSPAAQFAEALKQPATEVRAPQSSRTRVALAASLVVVAVLVATVVWQQTRTAPGPVTPATASQITFLGTVIEATLAPDGEFIAFVSRDADGTERLLVQEIGGGEPLEIHAHSFLCCVQWSPDATQLLFRAGTRTAGRTLVLPRLGGGTPRELNSEIITAWSPDGAQILSWWPQTERLLLTDVPTGDTTSSIPLEMPHVWVYGADWSRTDQLLAVVTQSEATSTLWTIPLGTRQPLRVLDDTTLIMSPRWSPATRAVYYLRSAQPQSFDLWKARLSSRGATRGDPVRLLTGLPVGFRHEAIPALSISDDGTRLLYLRQAGYSNLWLLDVRGTGGARTLERRAVTSGTAVRWNPRLSPDGREVAYVEASAGRSNVFVTAIAGGERRQITFHTEETWSPAWAPDGERIAYGTGTRGTHKVWIVGRDGGTPRVVATSQFDSGNRLAWAPSPTIVYQVPDDQNYHLLDPETAQETPLLKDGLHGWLYDPRPSPDGRHVAVWWNRTDSLPDGIWLVATSDGSRRFVREGLHPIGWHRSGEALFAMPTDPGGAPASEIYLVSVPDGRAELYVTLPFRAQSRGLDISPDGLRIVAAVEETQADAWMVENFDPEEGRAVGR
jgi:serine/threonine-protein kinase